MMMMISEDLRSAICGSRTFWLLNITKQQKDEMQAKKPIMIIGENAHVVDVIENDGLHAHHRVHKNPMMSGGDPLDIYYRYQRRD